MQFSVTSAYILGLGVMVVMLALAALIATLIQYEGGTNPQDPKKRRLWFWILCFLTPVFTFVLGYVLYYGDIRVPTLREKYMTAMCIASVASVVLYVVFGFVLSKLNKHGKLGNWF